MNSHFASNHTTGRSLKSIRTMCTHQFRFISSLYQFLKSPAIVVFCTRGRIRFPSHTIIHIKWTDLGSILTAELIL